MGWGALAAAEKVLQNYPAGEYQFQLVVEDVEEGEYPLAIHLIKDGNQVNREIFLHVSNGNFTSGLCPFYMKENKPEKECWVSGEESVEFVRRMGCTVKVEKPCWVSVEEDASQARLADCPARVEIFVRQSIEPNVSPALLLTQRYGVETRHNDYIHYGIEEGKLRELWRYDTSHSQARCRPPKDQAAEIHPLLNPDGAAK
jgi:hypothetical protein